MKIFLISRERFEIVHNDIADGSEPALRFYILVAVSTLIASFGLILNSTAVVIGAMLVAPLMTPIFGISLALVRGETGLFGRAIRAEIFGVIAAVTMSLLLGLTLGDFEPTNEMLSRTSPTLFDLLVAVLAGFAGAYALVDEKLSPALPGVAIATAIVPPLANCGLCLALGDVAAAVGSFLLFFANFLSILVVASITFVLSGMARSFGAREKGITLLRRFQLPIVAFVLIAAFLGNSLFQIAQERKMARGIREILIQETSLIPSTVLDGMNFYLEEEEDLIHVVANVSTPAILTPTQVSKIQNQLTLEIGRPIELIMHCALSSNVSARGSIKNAIEQHLDGTFAKSLGNDTLKDIAITEQIIREYFALENALDLNRVEFVPYGKRRLMLAHVFGFRLLSPQEIEQLQTDIRKASGDDSIELLISQVEKTIQTPEGAFRYGWFLGKEGTPDNLTRTRLIKADIVDYFGHDNAFTLVNANATYLDDKFHFLLEITGPELYPVSRIEQLQSLLKQKYTNQVDFYAWTRIEVVHGPEGPLSMKELSAYFSSRQKETLPETIPLILEASRR
ncbi:TIGR00341 family protein [Desulfopila sp. IMCC35008]|uniref:TIGR00341 family protein n=1 Tax=Desulfopila sp. IMCC35008 TaxID=2653858 RepID=UPI0013D4FDFD|nr:TIGR00341 family protein [Desulfopila sp. IMCC35008]